MFDARNQRLKLHIPRRALAVLVASCWVSAYGGPPFLTDDPEPVELHHVEVNLAVQDTRSDAARSGALTADVNWGCARELQCHFALPGAFSRSSGERTQAGVGDVEVGVKYRFFNSPDTGWMAAVYPTVYLPTGSASRGLGNGRVQILLPLWVRKSAGPWTWDVGAGYLLNRAPGARSSWFTGLVGQRSLTDRLTVGVELFHRTRGAEDAPPTTGFDVGAIVKLSANRNLLASVGRGVQGVAANRRSVYVAYQLEL